MEKYAIPSGYRETVLRKKIKGTLLPIVSKKLIVFDLDGTLIDSEASSFQLFSKVLKPYNLGPIEKVFETIRSQTPENLFDNILSKEDAQQALRQLQVVDKELSTKIELFPGIAKMLDALSSQNVHLALWTARDRASTERLLENLSLKSYFPYWLSGSCVSKNKPDSEGLFKIMEHYSCQQDDVVMVGDHRHDVEAALSQNCSAVLVRWKANPVPMISGVHSFTDPSEFTHWVMGRLKLQPSLQSLV